MADTGIFVSGAVVQMKAGLNASSTATAEAYTNEFIAEAESFINSVCKFNFSDSYATLNTDVKYLLRETASNLAAVYCINYDIASFPTVGQAETMLDVLRDRAAACLEILKEKDKQSFIKGA